MSARLACAASATLSVSTVCICLLFYPAMWTIVVEINDDIEMERAEINDLAEDAWKEIMALKNIAPNHRRYKKAADICGCLEQHACPAGAKGLPGEPGLNGLPGPSGTPGASGLSGIYPPIPLSPDGQCIPCPFGRPGRPGINGPPGGSGLKGIVGKPGMPSSLGRDGPAGNPGPAGFPGKDGVHGLKGDRGRESVRYYKGSPGLKGNPGIPGPMGPRGPHGIPGGSGRPGQQGPQGPPGTVQGAGYKGPPGPPGRQGSPGPDASYCSCPRRSRRLFHTAKIWAKRKRLQLH